MTPRRFLLTSVFFWCAAIVATPVLASYDGAAAKAASLSYQIFSCVCHQLDSHSFHLVGIKFAVCIRCFCIYASFFLGLLFFPIIRRTKVADVHPARVLILSLVPMGIDVALATFRIHESTTATRIITGLIFGLALAIILVPVLEEFSGKFLSQMRILTNALHSRKIRAGQTGMSDLLNLHNLQSAQNLRNQSDQPRIHYETETR